MKWIIDLADPTVDKKKTDQENFSIMLSLESAANTPIADCLDDSNKMCIVYYSRTHCHQNTS